MYKIVFKDKSTYQGGILTDSKWNEMPNKPIECILYSLPTNDILMLRGYDKYLHAAETIAYLSNKMGTKTPYIHIMGRRNDLTTDYRIDLQTGCIKVQSLIAGQEFSNKPIKGWKG